MKIFVRLVLIVIVVAAAAAAVPAYWPSLIWSDPAGDPAGPPPDAKRGEYVFHMAGCVSCHTAKGGRRLAGGRRLKTAFGTFVVPNITPDRDTGIGRWTERDFIRAMTLGLAPGGRHLYPAFPYTSYTRMTTRDLRDLWAYLKTVPAIANRTPGHELDFPYSIRAGVGLWKLLYLDAAPFRPTPGKPARWNRGAYIVTGPGHCGACHTPRNFLGGPEQDKALTGTASGPNGDKVPDITPDKKRGIGRWSPQEITFALQTGITPTGDVLSGAMADVVDHSTGKLTDADRRAIADYLTALPPGGGN